ncbi:gliding motility-associated ABC transporter substrate-binding protein GldG [Microscilla marina]|uniref:Gliding motility protein GldG n=1 Tax=Microscilla marina ATCC 23134 TaxID=313606 RepID=A1ZNU9_MICM2|nr:gliding motility-associated ABC transporter substrate-binding protein GldG [Microscilla marina]EAY27988.1 gliding motility protein GldG [Microscilla marina ATCC 23134]
MRSKHLIQFAIGLAVILVLNLVAGQFFFRLDLTEEKRYTISSATKKFLKNLPDEVSINVYLEGELPPDYKRLQTAIRETLNEFKIYAGNKLKYRFVNPFDFSDRKKGKAFLDSLAVKGVRPTSVEANKKDARTVKAVYPGALIFYKQYEMGTILLKNIYEHRNRNAVAEQQMIKQSIENVEFNLVSAIQKITGSRKKRIGFLEGHGELNPLRVADLQSALKLKNYQIYRVNLPYSEIIDSTLDAVVLAKPDSAFSRVDKYKLDQYIMNGGKALFFVDAVGVHMDSVMRGTGSFTFPYKHNLTDLLFRYGVRLNSDLIMDLQSSSIPMNIGNMGNRPNFQPVRWTYQPFINQFGKHLATKNIGMVELKMASTIDTVKANGIKKTPLLLTSKYSKTRKTPALIVYNEAQKKPDPNQYTQKHLPVAYMLEGSFKSMFAGQPVPTKYPYREKHKKLKKDQSQPTQVFVCSDGDFIRNGARINPKKQVVPTQLGIGYIGKNKVFFENRDFVVNVIEYMVNESNLIEAKNREITLRPLDKLRIEEDGTKWQWFNMLVPPLLIVLFGLVWFQVRKRTFARTKKH